MSIEQPTEAETKLKKLAWYVKKGWPIFPCGPDKSPLTTHGHKDASLDIEQIQKWNDQYPAANWGMPTGEKTKLVVIDIDKPGGKHKHDGFATWDQLREEHSDLIQTVTVITGSGGKQLYFKYPAGHTVRTGANILGPGVDIPINYVIVPGVSKTDGPYTFEFSPADTEIQELPSWILARVNGNKPEAMPEDRKPIEEQNQAEKIITAHKALGAMKQERRDNYDMWINVGMALHNLGKDGLILWDEWSKKSDKYKAGVCTQKWNTFDEEKPGNKITLGSLIYWAGEDTQPQKAEAPKRPKPQDYVNFFDSCGYAFTMNSMNDGIYMNGERMNDPLEAAILFDTFTYGYTSKSMALIALKKTARDNQFHPIKDYLTGLICEGKTTPAGMVPVDHIKKLAAYFEDTDNIFYLILKKWLVGAVGRVLGNIENKGPQNPMIVLDGPQGIGKSRFVWWLCSPLPSFHMQSSINPDSKDHELDMCSKFVWEVDEIGSTLRRADIEALKSFITKEHVTARAPYGHFDIEKPATVSYIGTVNNINGFLADPTGNRRFRVCTIKKINWKYETEIDINQIWAQAVALYEAGERVTLTPEEEKRIQEVTARFEIDEPLYYDLVKSFHVDPTETAKFTATAEIIHALRKDGKLGSGSDQQHAGKIANALVKLKCERGTRRVNKQLVRGWLGVWPVEIGEGA